MVSASFVGLSGLVGVLIGFVFVYKGFNRKHILLFSAIGTALAFIGLGIRGVIQSDPNGKFVQSPSNKILYKNLFVNQNLRSFGLVEQFRIYQFLELF